MISIYNIKYTLNDKCSDVYLDYKYIINLIKMFLFLRRKILKTIVLLTFFATD